MEGDDRVKARPRKPPEKDRRDRGPPPEQWKCYGAIAVSTAVLGQSHKDNVRCTAVDDQLGQLKAKLRGPTCSAQLHLPTHDL